MTKRDARNDDSSFLPSARRAQKKFPEMNISHPIPVSPNRDNTSRPESVAEITPQPIRKGEQAFNNRLYMGYRFTSGEDSS